MNTKNTSGPWRVRRRASGNFFIYADGVQSPICGVAFAALGVDADEAMANAQLIAAAPDLLSALMTLEREAELSLDYRKEFRAAIANAHAIIKTLKE